MIYWKSSVAKTWLVIMLVASTLFMAMYENSWIAGAKQLVTFVLMIAGVELLMNLIILFFPTPEPKEKK